MTSYLFNFVDENSYADARLPSPRKCERYDVKYHICDYNSQTARYLKTCNEIFKKKNKGNFQIRSGGFPWSSIFQSDKCYEKLVDGTELNIYFNQNVHFFEAVFRLTCIIER